jgi:hypothetical protein
MPASNRDDVLFQTFPITGEQTISTGIVPIPYHVYDGHGTLIVGDVDLAAAQQALANEALLPLQTQNRRGLLAVWLCNFTDASLGPHHEVQFSLFASREPAPSVADDRFGLLQALVADPDVQMLCHGLWNDTAVAVAYNRELLHLPAAISAGEVRVGNGRLQAQLTRSDGTLLVDADLTVARRTAVRTGIELIRLFGFQVSLQITAAPYLAAKIVNPISPTNPINQIAHAYIASNTPVLQPFHPTKDHLTIGPPYDAWQFQPCFIEHFTPFRFVYLPPEPVTDNS